ncbi:MAG TPA: type II toxin-antitoxin system RelE/ParE family toxin [Bryobacteraceae bacterium]|nr:type II toxin-antitoxin system RelE/ParE family toxin [Bryobacteraceae bacterium]
MKRRYRLTPEARFDLFAIWEYIARDNVAAADRVVKRLERAFHLLAAFPKKGHKRADVHTSRPVLFWPAGSYVIVYEPEPKPLVIVRIVHGARDLNALL